MTAPVRVGLVGAGPWARMAHAPMLAGGPETILAGVWARRPEAAEELAQEYGAQAFADYGDLLAHCDAIAFCVPPDVQAELATAAVRARLPVLLEKPIAGNLADAERLAAAITQAGVASLVLLSARFSRGVRDFLARVAGFGAVGGRACFLSGGLLAGPFAQSPWRQEQGALLDVGPHILDLLDVALGPIVDIQAAGHSRRFVALLCEHESGAVSQAALSADVGLDPGRIELEVFGAGGQLALDTDSAVSPDLFATARAEFAEIVRTGSAHPCDAQRGLYVQRLVAQAAAALDGRRT